MKQKEGVKFTLKGLVGALLIYYVLQSKMIDFGALKGLLLSPSNILTAAVFITLSLFFCTTRWYLLVKAQGLSISYKSLFSLTMIGAFFNTFMPGSVGGDIIKAWYVAGREKTRRTRAIMTVLLDRVIGLAVILLYAAFTLLLFSSWLEQHSHLKPVAYSLWLLGFIMIFAAVLFFSSWFWKWKVTKKVLKLTTRYSKISKLVDSALIYRSHPRTFFYTVALSSFSVLGLTFLYIIQGHRLGIEMTTAQYFFVVPVALVVSAIPILPGGIGTGQVAFYHLFLWLGIKDPNLGGTLCTLVQIYNVAFNCLGAFFYLRYKHDPQMSKVDLSSSLTLA